MFSISSLSAQPKLNLTQKKKWIEANDRFEITDYLGAIDLYQGLYKFDTLWIELHYKSGIGLFNSRSNKQGAVPYLEKAAGPEFPEAYLTLAGQYHLELRFVDAIAALEDYLNVPGEK